LCGYFYSYLFITEDHKVSISIFYVNASTSTHSDIIYKTEGFNDNDSDDNNDKDDNYYDNDKHDGASEEESFEIEQEIKHIKNLLKLSEKAVNLDKKLPESEKEKNSHLNDIRKDPHVREFFEGKTPNISDLPELNKALV
jgi:hypothetical protein